MSDTPIEDKKIKVGWIDAGFKYGRYVVVAFVICGGAVMAYNKIFENEAEIKKEKESRKKAIDGVLETFEKEMTLRDSRADKRYKRALDLGTELKEIIKYHDAELERVKEDAAYERGKLDMYLEMENRHNK